MRASAASPAKPWVKTCLAPGSRVVTDYLRDAGPARRAGRLGFNMVGYGCTTCIGNSGPLKPEISAGVKAGDLIACSVLSGNRNFEGRVHPEVKHELPRLAAAGGRLRARRHAGHRPDHRAARHRQRRHSPCTCKDIWPSAAGSARRRAASTSTRRCSARATPSVFDGDEHWKAIKVPDRQDLRLGREVDLREEPALLRRHDHDAGRRRATSAARACSRCSATRSPPTTSRRPATSPRRSPAAKYLIEQGVQPVDFNQYGARRGNHEVMMRGTFANIRLRNLLVPGTEGGVTLHLPERRADVDLRRRDALQGRQARRWSILAGKEYGTGSSRDWAAKGTHAARREGGDRRELRAHPPLEPDRHGRAAAAVPGRARAPPRSASPARRSSRSPGSTTADAREGHRRRDAGERRRSRSSSRRACASTRRRSATTTTTAASCSTCCGSSRRRDARPERAPGPVQYRGDCRRPRSLAIFDLDGTITRRDTLLPYRWASRCAARGACRCCS